jgi:hypothetical protein
MLERRNPQKAGERSPPQPRRGFAGLLSGLLPLLAKYIFHIAAVFALKVERQQTKKETIDAIRTTHGSLHCRDGL